jgi:hypothetical protein
MTWLLVPLFAVLYRMRGGWLKPSSTTWCRLVYWSLPIAAWGGLTFGPLGLLCGVGAYLGLMIPHGEWFAGPSIRDAAMMGIIGMARAFLIVFPVAGNAPEVGFTAFLGLLSGVAYWVGWHWIKDWASPVSVPSFRVFGVRVDGGNFASGPTAWGEVLTGAVFGCMFALAGG